MPGVFKSLKIRALMDHHSLVEEEKLDADRILFSLAEGPATALTQFTKSGIRQFSILSASFWGGPYKKKGHHIRVITV
jgi:hypothetical protein